MSIQSEINRIKSNVQNTLNVIASTGVSVGTNSDDLEEAANALANTKQDVINTLSVTLAAASWTESDDGFTQAVTIAGGTANSLVALQPTVAQIIAMQGAGVSALVVNNDNGAFTAYAVGAAPTEDMTMQITLTEVSA